MTEILKDDCGKRPAANLEPPEVLRLMNKVMNAKLVTAPYRIKMIESEVVHGCCETVLNEDGTVAGHDIGITVANDGLIAHELAHARVNELYKPEEISNRHGVEFHRALLEIIESIERSDA